MSNKSPEEVLKEIYGMVSDMHGMVSDMHNEDEGLPEEPRFNPSKGTLRYEALKTVAESGSITAAEVKEKLGDSGVTGALSRLYNGYCVDRTEKKPYEYEVTSLGKTVLDGFSHKNSLDWSDVPVTESEYITLQSINEYDGHPLSSDLDPYLNKHGFVTQSSNSSAAPRLSKLFENGFVDRTPTQPYRYWITEEGEELLEEYGNVGG